MIRQLLEEKGLQMNDLEFTTVMVMATQDIKFNNIGFNRRTSINDVMNVAEKSLKTLRRCV